jgi:hypothetical protein
MGDNSYQDVKSITDSIYSGKLKNPTAEIFLEILNKYRIKLRQKDGVFDHITYSISKSQKDCILIGIRYRKKDCTFTEDHFLFQKIFGFLLKIGFLLKKNILIICYLRPNFLFRYRCIKTSDDANTLHAIQKKYFIFVKTTLTLRQGCFKFPMFSCCSEMPTPNNCLIGALRV